jgi:DNA-binding ferritin-like protein (Dps family)
MTMARNIIELVVGDLSDKRKWREYKARVKALPDGYRTAVEGIEKYLLYSGGVTSGPQIVAMVNDLADLFERAAADGTPIRSIVGSDPVEFVDAFVANYSDGGWLAKHQQKLNDAIAKATGETAG